MASYTSVTVIGLPDLSSSVFHLPIGEVAFCAEAEKTTEASRPTRMKLRIVDPLPGRWRGAARPMAERRIYTAFDTVRKLKVRMNG